MANMALLLFLLFFVTSGRANFLVNRLIDELADTLIFGVQNNQLIDTNLLFGVAIIAGQLQVIASYDLTNNLQSKINQLKLLCQNIFENGFNKNNTKINFDRTPKILFSQQFWTFDNIPKSLTKREKCPSNSSTRNSYRIQSEDEIKFRFVYESCLRILLRNCRFPKKCFEQIINYESSGYVLTHQILYLQTMKQALKKNLCATDSISLSVNYLDHVMNEKCCEVFAGVQGLKDQIATTKNEALIDLLLEDVVVCGLQTFVEFFSWKFLDLILTNDFAPMTATFRKSFDETYTNNAIHLMSVRAAAQVLYLKKILFDWIL